MQNVRSRATVHWQADSPCAANTPRADGLLTPALSSRGGEGEDSDAFAGLMPRPSDARLLLASAATVFPRFNRSVRHKSAAQTAVPGSVRWVFSATLPERRHKRSGNPRGILDRHYSDPPEPDSD